MGHKGGKRGPGRPHKGHIADSARCITRKQARKEKLGSRMAARRVSCPACSGQFNRCEWKRHSQRCDPKKEAKHES
jgi:hypothetical protein